MASISCRIMFFRSSRVAGRLWYTQLLRYPHRKNHKESDLGFGGGTEYLLFVKSIFPEKAPERRAKSDCGTKCIGCILQIVEEREWKKFEAFRHNSENSLLLRDNDGPRKKKKRADYSRCRHCSPNCDLRAMQRPFMFLFGVLFTPVAAILIIDMAIKVEMSLIGE